MEKSDVIRIERALAMPKEVGMTEPGHLDLFRKAYREAAVNLGIPNVQWTIEVFGEEWDAAVKNNEISGKDIAYVNGILGGVLFGERASGAMVPTTTFICSTRRC